MSQSDYIKFKRVSTILNNSKNLPKKMNERDYLDYNQFTVENISNNTSPNTKITYNRLQLQPTVYQSVWNMDKVIDCSSYTVFCSLHPDTSNNIITGITQLPLNIKQIYAADESAQISKKLCACILLHA
jgi:hypothetical protein